MTVRTIDDIYRDFVIDGVPASGPFNPYKPDIRDTLKALTEGGQNFPDNRVIRLNNANVGTPNNIIVTASVAIPAAAYQVLYILNVTQSNTGPVTVTGAINRDLVTNTSAPVPAGYLTPGMAVLCVDTGTALRMLSYGDERLLLAKAEEVLEETRQVKEEALAETNAVKNNAILETNEIKQETEAVRDFAARWASDPENGPLIDDGTNPPNQSSYHWARKSEAARDLAAGYASDAVSQGNVPIYSTAVGVAALEIPAGITAFRTNGYYSAGDGGAALYTESAVANPGGLASNDGTRFWALVASDNQIDFAAFGGVDDGVTDNADYWQAMRLYCIDHPTTEIILTQRYSGRFVVNTNFWTASTERYRVRGDVTIVSPQASYRVGTTVIEGELKLLNSVGGYEYQIPSLVNRRFRELMSAGDLDQSREKVFAPSTWRKISHVIGSDTTQEVTSGITTYPRFAIITGNVIPVSYPGRWTGGVVPVAAKNSYSFGFRPATWNSAGAIIITTKGVHVFYGNRTTRTVTHYYKEVGVAHTTTIIPSVENIGGDYPTDQIGYRFPWASVSVDIPDPNSFQVCINGVALTAPINDGGVVLEVGPVINPGSTSTAQPGDDVTVAGITARESYLPPSLRARGLLYVGSSSTDPAMVSWPFYLEDALQQSFGMQVVRSLNIGLSGGTTTTQLAALQAVDFSGPFPPYTDILCFVGANDIQNQDDRPTFQANIEAMIGIADANSCGILFLLPQIFYSKTEGGGTGSTTTNSEKHALYREYINMVVAEKRATGSRCSVLDTDRVLGPILYGYKSYPNKEMEPVIVDNIHISAYSRHQLGVAAARKLMGLYAIRQSGEGGRVSIPDGWKQNGWTGGASFNVCNRIVLISGELSGGTATDATVILKLPVGLRPAASVTLPITAGAAGVGRLLIATNGDVSLYGVPTATVVNLGNIQFRLD